MDNSNKLGFLNLAKKSFAAMTTSLSVLLNGQSQAIIPIQYADESGKNLNHEKFQKRILKPKLVLKLNLNNPETSFLASHTSHSSHSSHRSHSSHYSSASHNSGNGGSGIGYWLLGGAALAYGAYQLGKNRNKK